MICKNSFILQTLIFFPARPVLFIFLQLQLERYPFHLKLEVGKQKDVLYFETELLSMYSCQQKEERTGAKSEITCGKCGDQLQARVNVQSALRVGKHPISAKLGETRG